MTDIFRDVDEAVRRERYLYLWRRYGAWLVSAITIMAISLAAALFWNAQSRQATQEASLELDKALTLKEEERLPAIAQLARQGGVYAEMARFHEAALLAKKGDKDAALAIYRALANSGEIDEALQSLASLHAAALLIGRAPLRDVEAILADSLKKDAPFQASAREIAALATLLAGEKDKARSLYQQLSQDPAAPPSLRARSRIMLQSLPDALPLAKDADAPANKPNAP